MRRGRTRVCIYVGHMVVSTVLGPPRTRRGLPETSGGAGFHPVGITATPSSESPHEFSMRLAAHLCRGRPHRHHRPWTKLVNLLTARTFSMGAWGGGGGSRSAPTLFPSAVYAPYVHLPHKLILAGSHRPASPRCVTVIENTGFFRRPSSYGRA